MDLFEIIFLSIAILCIIVGLVGQSVHRKKKENDPEYETQMRELEREKKRRAAEEKDMEDFISSSNGDYL